jgi:hypothetical protein
VARPESKPYSDRTVLVGLRLLVGLVLLLAGRRLYWLFVAVAGFLAGLELVPRLLPSASPIVVVLAAAAVGLAGALLAVAAQAILIALAGFVAGAAGGVLLLGTVRIDADTAVLVAGLVGGIIGALVSFLVFDWALILLSSLAGASMIVSEVSRLVALPAAAPVGLVLALAALGVLVQAHLLVGEQRARA